MAVPSEQAMRDAGERLGLLEAGEPIPPRLRGKLARVVEEAALEDAAEQSRRDQTERVLTPLIDAYTGLVEAGVPVEAAGRIAAALAPHIWRANT